MTILANEPTSPRRSRVAALRPRGAVLAAVLVVAAAAPGRGGQPTAAAVDFSRDIRPILSNNCFACHGPDENQRQGIRLDVEEEAKQDLGGYAAVVPGDVEQSELIRRVTADDPFERMPPAETGKRLSRAETQRLTDWVRQGAPWARHWAYVKPQRPPLPPVRLGSWPRNEIDYFVLARLEQEGLRPSPEADRYALIRRVTLDLTGLPPTPQQADQFVEDRDPAAYEKLVDRLLDRPAYGEHWARQWLDAARYADSAGYADDPPRTIWAYRDYVVRSLNDNKPFDQFTVEQIAGDLLPHPTDDQLAATAFHRNTLTNNEGGTNDEEFRNVAIVDRVNTTMAVWMGVTMGCAQCHNHKYDPITQEEYFRLFAVFNNTADADRKDESPVLQLYSDSQQRQMAAWRGQLEELQRELAALENRDEAADALRQRSEQLQKHLDQIKPYATVPIMQELPPQQRRQTHLQRRGNYLDLGEEVAPGLPSAISPYAGDRPPDRLALARWLVDADNPLTARVAVNRYWQAIFGVGLVRTSEDFGSQGELPSHPELLDWLATELIRRRWDVKALVRQLVASAAYRQSSCVTPELWQRDPDNRLLARGPRFRMSAEMVRDQALFVSGLLSDQLYGPPVRPPQPSLGLRAAFGGGTDWETSNGPDRYRRALYTSWRRSHPYPSLATFDAPNREVCTLRRNRTNTPLQALVTLNDPAYVEAAQALARRLDRGGDTRREKARYGFRLCLARPPTERELDRLAALWETARGRFQQDPDHAQQLATDPLGPAPAGSDVADLAAWTAVGNVLLNLDETLMKR